MSNRYTRRINLYINGKEVKNDIASISKAMYKLTNEQRRMTRGSDKYVAHAKKIKFLKGIIQKHNSDLRDTGSRWFNLQKIASGFNKYFTLFASFIAGFGGVILGLKKTISQFAEFDDKLADVMKTTGLTKIEVKELNEELKKIDTRTAQLELLDLARVAGKLGITGKEEIIGFVRAADQIKVALTEDLGGDVEESIRQLGKLSDIFKIKDKYGTEQALLKIGSAINSLGASSTANEGFMVEFAKRVAGIAPSAGISIDKILGLGATLDQLGQTSEVSSTVFSQIIPNMFKDTATYADIAKMSVADFSKLLKTDANEAFVKVLEGINGNNAGFESLVKKLEKLGLDGKRTISVLGVLSNNTKSLREQQAFANKEFEKGTSLTEEFNTKNDTAQATLEKYRKALYNISVELGETLLPVLTASTRGMSYLIKALNIIIPWMVKYKKVLVLVASAITAYYTRLAILWALEKARNITLAGNIVVTKLMIAVTGKATMAQKRLLVATRATNAATKATPWGLIITLLATAAAAFITFSKKVKEATKEQNEFNEVLKKSNELMGQTKTLEERASIVKNLSKEQLDTLKSDLQNQLSEENNFHATLLQKLKKSLDEDVKLNQLASNLRNDGLTAEQKERLKISIGNRKEQIARELEEENKGNQARLKNLKTHLTNVNTELKKHPEEEVGTPDEDKKAALKALDLANKQRILQLKEQYGAEENMQKFLQARLLANELAYLQAKLNLETDESKSLDLQTQIVDKQNAYNKAIADAIEPLKLKKEAVEELNQKLLEEGKLTQRNAEIAAKAASDQEDLNAKLTDQANMYLDTIDIISQGMFDMMSGSEDAFKHFAKNILIFALEQLKIQAQLAAAGATVASLAQPDSIATFGATGLVRAAIIVGLIEAAFAGLEGLVHSAFATGKYPDAQYAGRPQTGMYGDKPQLGIFNEVPGQPEMVIDGITTRNINVNYPGIMDAIYAIRDGKQPPQFAKGNYPNISNPSQNPSAPQSSDPELKKLIENNTTAMQAMLKLKIYTSIEDIKTGEKNFTNIQNTRGL